MGKEKERYHMEFEAMLKKLRTKAGKSRYKLSQWSGLSEGYLLRLENGERSNPSREVVVMLAMALVSGSENITLFDVEDLLLSAGYAPLRRRGQSEVISARGF